MADDYRTPRAFILTDTSGSSIEQLTLELAAMHEQIDRLTHTLTAGRHTAVSVGVLMERHQIAESAAIDLVNDAQEQRRDRQRATSAAGHVTRDGLARVPSTP